MSLRVDIVVGLPASGKSHVVRELAKIGGRRQFHDWHGWNPDRDNEEYRKVVVDELESGRGCVLESSRFTTRTYIEDALVLIQPYATEIVLTIFENHPLTCVCNAYGDYLQKKRSVVGNTTRVRDIMKFFERYDPQRRIGLSDTRLRIQRRPVYRSNHCEDYVLDEKSLVDTRIDEIRRCVTGVNGELLKDRELRDLGESGCSRLMQRIGEVLAGSSGLF